MLRGKPRVRERLHFFPFGFLALFVAASAAVLDESAAVVEATDALRANCSLSPRSSGEVAECDIWGDVRFGDPFDDSDVLVYAILTQQGRSARTVRGFYYQPFARRQVSGDEVLTAAGAARFRLRFPASARSRVEIVVEDTRRSRVRQLPAVDVQGAGAHEPVFTAPCCQTCSSFCNDDRIWFAVGENIAWTNSSGTYAYDAYLSNLGTHGANMGRVWLTDREWDDLALETTLGSINLANAWRVDHVLEEARAHDIRLILTIESFNYFCSWTGPCMWNRSVYNVANGGPCHSADEIFTNTEAQKLFQRRVEYIAARYSAYSSALALEAFNEVDLVDDFASVEADATTWHRRIGDLAVAASSRKIMFTTSFSNSSGSALIQELPQISFTTTHSYGAEDMVEDITKFCATKWTMFRKPTLVEEFGLGNIWGNATVQGMAALLRHGMAAGLAAPCAGGAMTWWWDLVVDRDPELYSTFAVVRRLTVAMAPGPTMVPAKSIVSNERAAAVGACSRGGSDEHCVVLVRSRSDTWRRISRGDAPTPLGRTRVEVALGRSCAPAALPNAAVHDVAAGALPSAVAHDVASGALLTRAACQCTRGAVHCVLALGSAAGALVRISL